MLIGRDVGEVESQKGRFLGMAAFCKNRTDSGVGRLCTSRGSPWSAANHWDGRSATTRDRDIGRDDNQRGRWESLVMEALGPLERGGMGRGGKGTHKNSIFPIKMLWPDRAGGGQCVGDLRSKVSKEKKAVVGLLETAMGEG